MALTANIMHGHESSDEMHPQSQAKKIKVKLYELVVYEAENGILSAVHY